MDDSYVYLPEYDEILSTSQFEQITKGHFLGTNGWREYFNGLRKVHVHQDPEPSVKPLPGVPEVLSIAG